jgi:hypothetical protein
MEEEILKYLAQYDPAHPVSINHLLLAQWPDWDQGVNKHITASLQSLVSKKFITILYDQHVRLGTQNPYRQGALYTLTEDQILCSITYEGLKELDGIKFHKDLLQVNQSVIDTNNALRSFNAFQKTISRLTLAVAAISLIAIGLSAYYASLGATAEEFLKINNTLQNNTRILDSIRIYQKGIDSSVRKAVKDSFYVHRH